MAAGWDFKAARRGSLINFIPSEVNFARKWFINLKSTLNSVLTWSGMKEQQFDYSEKCNPSQKICFFQRFFFHTTRG